MREAVRKDRSLAKPAPSRLPPPRNCNGSAPNQKQEKLLRETEGTRELSYLFLKLKLLFSFGRDKKVEALPSNNFLWIFTFLSRAMRPQEATYSQRATNPGVTDMGSKSSMWYHGRYYLTSESVSPSVK